MYIHLLKIFVASKELSFYLIPHNFFEEDPSIASRDANVKYVKN